MGPALRRFLWGLPYGPVGRRYYSLHMSSTFALLSLFVGRIGVLSGPIATEDVFRAHLFSLKLYPSVS